MFITGLPLGYFTLVFSKLNTLAKFEWTGQQNHKRNRFFKFSFYFSFFFFFRSTTLSMQTRPWAQFTTSQVCRCVQGVWKTLYLFLRMNVKLLQPFQSKKSFSNLSEEELMGLLQTFKITVVEVYKPSKSSKSEVWRCFKYTMRLCKSSSALTQCESLVNLSRSSCLRIHSQQHHKVSKV